ncbi:hypothetical protein LZ32DRAFT_603295 [Colletotrichum eremochloae]|nr:hypothetical protein LZ32DRAFT_603295 [Colletotrichum eremochloae]
MLDEEGEDSNPVVLSNSGILDYDRMRSRQLLPNAARSTEYLRSNEYVLYAVGRPLSPSSYIVDAECCKTMLCASEADQHPMSWPCRRTQHHVSWLGRRIQILHLGSEVEILHSVANAQETEKKKVKRKKRLSGTVVCDGAKKPLVAMLPLPSGWHQTDSSVSVRYYRVTPL